MNSAGSLAVQTAAGRGLQRKVSDLALVASVDFAKMQLRFLLMKTVTSKISPTLSRVPGYNTSSNARRNYDNAILDSCKRLSAPDAEKDKTIWIIDIMKLQPFAVIDSDDIEDVALMHGDKLANRIKRDRGNVVRLGHVASGRKCKWESATSSSIPGNDMEAALLLNTYYGPSHQQYSELDNTTCQMMNDDWTLLPQLRFACSQLLSGATVMNDKKKPVILNSMKPMLEIVS